MAPCKICKCACDCFGSACKECGSACGAIANCICMPFTAIYLNPLGGYVLWTLATAVFVVCGAAVTLSRIVKDTAAAGGDCEDSKTACIAMIAIATAHAGFALYIQRRLVAHIGKEGSSLMTSKEIVEKTKHVMLYDVVFCLYCPCFLAAWAYACSTFAAFENCEVKAGPAWGAAALLVFYGFVTSNYVAWWFCCQCCCAQVESVKGVHAPSEAPSATAVPAAVIGPASGEATV